MKQSSSFTATLLVVVLVTLQAFEPLLTAQSASLTPQQLDQLLSPIALYPELAAVADNDSFDKSARDPRRG